MEMGSGWQTFAAEHDHDDDDFEPLTPTIDAQIVHLRRERSNYAARICELAGRRDRADEVGGYMRMIENINCALMRLSRGALASGVIDQTRLA